MSNKILINRDFFLALYLSSKYQTKIDGLKVKYPTALFPLPKEKYLGRISMRDDFYLKSAFALVNSSKTNTNLWQDLIEILKIKHKRLFKAMQAYQKETIQTDVSIYHILNYDDERIITEEEMVQISIVDYFCDYLKLTQKETEDVYRIVYFFEQNYFELLDVMQYEQLKVNVSKKSSDAYKLAEDVLKSYLKQLDITLDEFLNFRAIAAYHDPNFQLGSMLLPNSKMTKQEALIIIYIGLTECQDGDILKWLSANMVSCLYMILYLKQLDENTKLFNRYYPLETKSEHQKMIQNFNNKEKQLQSEKKENETLKQELIQTRKDVQTQVKQSHEKYRKQLKDATFNQTRLEQKLNDVTQSYNILLKEYEQLKNQKESQTIVPVVTLVEEVVDDKINQSLLEQLNQSSILIVGGSPKTVNRLKQILPKCKYMYADEKKKNSFFKGVKHSVLLNHDLTHAASNRLKKQCPNVKLMFLTETNEKAIIKKMSEKYANSNGSS